MRITFIRCNTNAVGEYRAHHPALALRRLGHDVKLITLPKGGLSIANTELVCDVLVLCRFTSEKVFDLLDTLTERPTVVYEIDDNPWEWHSWDPIHSELGYDYGSKVRAVMARCDAVTVSTPTLARRIRQEFPSMSIWTVPNAIDYGHRDWEAREDRHESGTCGYFVLGWTGSIHHTRDGGAMLQALPAVFDRYPDTVFLMQCDRPLYYQWTMPLVGRYKDRLRWAPPVTFDIHPQVYSLFDVNLAPLERTPFNACKSDLRLIEGGAHGVPYVASKVAPYLEFDRATGSIGGYIAHTPAEWAEAIGKLIEGERDARGQSLRRHVKETRALDVVAGQWTAALEGARDGHPGASVDAVEEAGRNAPCPCGSGRKTKRCCGGAYATV